MKRAGEPFQVLRHRGGSLNVASTGGKTVSSHGLRQLLEVFRAHIERRPCILAGRCTLAVGLHAGAQLPELRTAEPVSRTGPAVPGEGSQSISPQYEGVAE
jgi:hypothetical protein